MVGNNFEGDDERVTSHSLSDKLPPNVKLTWPKGDLEQQDYQKILNLRKQDELASPPILFELFFHQELVYQIAEFKNMYVKKENADNTFELSNEKLRLFLAILQTNPLTNRWF